MLTHLQTLFRPTQQQLANMGVIPIGAYVDRLSIAQVKPFSRAVSG